MKRFYTFLTGKKMLGTGLAALAALTVLLAVTVNRTGESAGGREASAESSAEIQAEETKENETRQQAAVQKEDDAGEGFELAAADTDNVYGIDVPDGSEVGHQQLVEQSDEEIPVAAGTTQLISMNLAFDGTSSLAWPVAGRELAMDFSMDSVVYYSTLEVYKVCPAVMIRSIPGEEAFAPENGLVLETGTDEEIGGFIRMKLGEEFTAVIGNLSEIRTAPGEYIQKGSCIGTVGEPTKYYKTEGTNLYFSLLRNDEPTDPLEYLK